MSENHKFQDGSKLTSIYIYKGNSYLLLVSEGVELLVLHEHADLLLLALKSKSLVLAGLLLLRGQHFPALFHLLLRLAFRDASFLPILRPPLLNLMLRYEGKRSGFERKANREQERED